MARVQEDKNVDRAQQRAAQIPVEYRIRTYEGKTPDFVEIIDAVGPEDYRFRSYFYLGEDASNDARGEYMCYVTTKMSRPPYSVTVPQDGGVVTLVDPVDFVENQGRAKELVRTMTILFVQSMPPSGFRVARVLLT